MKINRRRFNLLVAAGLAGCWPEGRRLQAAVAAPLINSAQGKVVDVGPLSEYTDDDVYDQFREQGVFVIRRDKQILALSSICTHKGCKLRVADDLSFFCKCHGSKFDKNGHVTKGPAKRNLPRLAVALDNNGHVLVDLNQATSQNIRLDEPGD